MSDRQERELRERRQYERQQEEEEYYRACELQSNLDQAANDLMSHGYIVIPPCDIQKYMGFSFQVTKKPPVEISTCDDDDEIPF